MEIDAIPVVCYVVSRNAIVVRRVTRNDAGIVVCYVVTRDAVV